MKSNLTEIIGHLEKKGDIASLCVSHHEKDDEPHIIDTLLTDSRNLRRPAHSLFFAIATKGGNDGHRYMKQLFDRGVKYFVAEHLPDDFPKDSDAVIILVKDSVKALRHIGELSKKIPAKRVAITGSRGKTTLKEWIFQLMEPICRISRSPRSFNSKIGVPLSLWQISEETDTAIIEAGISEKGEMALLAQTIDPHTVIFTNIGDAHSEGFASLKEKAEEKALLAKGEKVEKIIYNADDNLLYNALLPYLEEKKSIGWSLENPEADLYFEKENSGNDTSIILNYRWGNKTHRLKLPFIDKIDLENTAASVAFMLSEGFSPHIISERLSHLHKIGTRLNVTEGVNGCSVIYDSYTSDVSSLQPAVDFMIRRKMPGQSPVIIMCDMLHEASSTKEAYRKVAEIVKESEIERFIGIGEKMIEYSYLFPEKSRFFQTTATFFNEMSASDFSDEIILIKGSPKYDLSGITGLLEIRRHETVLEVNLDSIVANYNFFRSHIPSSTGIIAMVKASGYGAGSHEIAKTLQDCGASYLAVAVLDEGIDLRRDGIRMPIMVMNPRSANYRPMFNYRLEPEIYSIKMLGDVIYEAKKNNIKNYPVHLKLDTGMHRMGLIEEEIPLALQLLNSQDGVRVETIFSHLATSDCLDMDDYTLEQLNLFHRLTDKIQASLPYRVKRHILNSAGILRFPEFHYDFVRLGIGLYGANTLPDDIEPPLSVVSTLRTVIIAIRDREENETVGYGRKGVVKKKSRIATIPIGYADGMNRRFGNGKITVRVNGKDAPTVGNICMDACMIDVTDIDCKEGDAVEIFGNEAPLQRLADVLETIPYEILTSVSPRVKRVYFRE